ncbi:hypothetical protein V6N12_076512 [Hibiscus sabdariffa]|uniref:Uncharacterized protein n=1 Tax=Hibiscus sabdariffa TaxID=183260 RepID=A0ABR2DBR7_9ROSI
METVRLTKKGRSDFGLTTGMEVEDTEMNGLVSGDVKSATLNGETTDGKTTTYAAMVAKSGVEDSCSKWVLNFSDEEVVILDEDCLVDEFGAFSTIKFSDRVHDHIDKISETLSSVGPRLDADVSLTKHYGPWMVAASRQHHYNTSTTRVMNPTAAIGNKLGSRFAELSMAEDDAGMERTMKGNGMKFNKAYMPSNPKRQSKGGKGAANGPKAVEVVSLIEGVAAEDVVRDVSAKVGRHAAVTVMDGTHVSKGLVRAGARSSKQ